MMHGKGKFTGKNGETYEGEYLNGLKNGYGVFSWCDGRIYEGYFKDGF